MPASTQRSKRPIILLVTPHQIENKFLTQKHLPQINARVKVRRKQDEPPLELNAIISNPFYKPVAGGGREIEDINSDMRDCIDDCRETRNARVRALKAEQEGGRLIKSKKLRKKLQQGSLALQAGAIGSAALGQPELAAPLEAASLGAQALAGLGKKKTGNILRGIHEVSNASRGIETGGYGSKKLKKKARYALQNSE